MTIVMKAQVLKTKKTCLQPPSICVELELELDKKIVIFNINLKPQDISLWARFKIQVDLPK